MDHQGAHCMICPECGNHLHGTGIAMQCPECFGVAIRFTAAAMARFQFETVAKHAVVELRKEFGRAQRANDSLH